MIGENADAYHGTNGNAMNINIYHNLQTTRNLIKSFTSNNEQMIQKLH